MERRASDEVDDGHPLYIRVRRLGRGVHGSVWLGQRRTPSPGEADFVALKYVTANPDFRVNLMREVFNHLKLHHPHIVRLHRVSHHRKYVVLELEAMRGGDMQKYMQKFPNGMPEYLARWYFQQILLAVGYCHEKFTTHRDIKLENILLSTDTEEYPQAKLCDFGWSKDEVDSAACTQAGTPAYVAPEVLSGTGETNYDGDKADSWSLGVVLYHLLVGKLPFWRSADDALPESQRPFLMAQRIMAASYEVPPDRNLSPEVQDLISKLLTKDAASRPTVRQILHTMPWVFKGDNPDRVATTQGFTARVMEVEATAEWKDQLKRRMEHTEGVFRGLGWEGPRKQKEESYGAAAMDE